MLKKTWSFFYFVSTLPTCLSFWKSQSENLFYTEINIEKGDSKTTCTSLPLHMCMGISFLLDCVEHMSDVLDEALECEDSFYHGQAGRQGQVKSCAFYPEQCSQNNKEEQSHVLLGVSLFGGFCVVFLEGFTLIFFRNSTVVWDDYRQSLFPRERTMFSSLTGWGKVQLTCCLPCIRSCKIQEEWPGGLWRFWPRRMACEGGTQALVCESEWVLTGEHQSIQQKSKLIAGSPDKWWRHKCLWKSMFEISEH